MSDEHQPSAWAKPGTPSWRPGEITRPEPAHDDIGEQPNPGEVQPDPDELQAQLRRRRRDWIVAGIVSTVLLLCAGTVVFRNWYVDHATAREQAKVDQWATEQGKKGSWPAAKKALDTQAAALLRGDEQGWLAAVDPAQPQLRDYYRRLYTAMRALDVSGWEYFVTSPGPYENWGASWIELDFTIGYCVAVATCTRYDSALTRCVSGRRSASASAWTNATGRTGSSPSRRPSTTGPPLAEHRTHVRPRQTGGRGRTGRPDRPHGRGSGRRRPSRHGRGPVRR
ncbi:hypothetical protein [Paractinoplanes durhamensis]|uniref:hypothetical protein n=1 Tax=Paractinoplanes durhamensis TaxID=113563 RepID=UPI003629D092